MNPQTEERENANLNIHRGSNKHNEKQTNRVSRIDRQRSMATKMHDAAIAKRIPEYSEK